jgi:hypothetical protein
MAEPTDREMARAACAGWIPITLRHHSDTGWPAEVIEASKVRHAMVAQMFAFVREVVRREVVKECLDILDDEGWHGMSRQRIAALTGPSPSAAVPAVSA